MDYKTLSVKTFIEDMNGKEIMMKTVPSLTKYPLKLFYKKTVGDIVRKMPSRLSSRTSRRSKLSHMQQIPCQPAGDRFFACQVYITLIFALKRKKPD